MPNTYAGTWDADHEGHGGWTSEDILGNLNAPTWLGAYTPDVVLVHLGTNDVFGYAQASDAEYTVSNMREIVSTLRADNPNVQIYMAKILPITSNYMPEDGGPASSVINGFVTALNDGLALLAAELQSAQSPIVLVDMNSGFGNAQLPDGIHPNVEGAQEMAQRWFNALLPQLAQSGDTGNNGADNSNNTTSNNAPELAFSSGLALLDDTDAHPHHGIVTQDGGFAIIGETSIELRFTMFFVVTDANGNERFKVDLGQGAISNGNHVLQLPDGHFLVAGSHDLSSVINADEPGQEHERVIMKIHGTTGEVLHTQHFPAAERMQSVVFIATKMAASLQLATKAAHTMMNRLSSPALRRL